MFRAEARKKRDGTNITHILLPYKGTAREQELLKTVCKIAQAYRARLSVVYVLEVPMTLPINTDSPACLDEANAVLDHAEDIARSAGMKIKGDLLQARDAGHAIVEEAGDRVIDLIFMEAKHDDQMGMQGLGKTVDYVLKHAPCAVWISRLLPPVQQP